MDQCFISLNDVMLGAAMGTERRGNCRSALKRLVICKNECRGQSTNVDINLQGLRHQIWTASSLGGAKCVTVSAYFLGELFEPASVLCHILRQKCSTYVGEYVGDVGAHFGEAAL